MPTMIKPRTLGVLTKAERRLKGAAYIVTALGLFDLARPEADRFETDQTLWTLAAKALPKGSILDLGMPKPCAELLIGGSAVAPGREPVPAMMLEWLVGSLCKRVAVMGDRYWQLAQGGAVQTAPKPFVEMPIEPARAFGGPGHPDNPVGIGFKPIEKIEARQASPLPNLELADRLIRSIDQVPPPALCGPIDPASPKRRRFAGTYDTNWIKTEAPGLPGDVDPRFFLLAPQDQQFPGYLEGGEPYALRGFCAEEPELRGTLPRFRVRAFLARKPIGEAEAELAEVTMRIDTLWLFAGARRGVLVYRGALPVSDIDADDLSHVMLAYERGEDEPRPRSHYEEVWRLRADRKESFKHAFSEGQLAPALSPETTARRDAERTALQRERLEKHAAGQRWMIERQLRASGLPEALWPAIPEPEIDPDLAALPMPTPEELESGEVDLAALLDAAEALQKKIEAKMAEAQAKVAPMQEAMTALTAPEAGPEAVDALFAALDGLGAGNPAPDIDAALADVKLPDLPVEADPNILEEAAAKLEGLKDWRMALLDAAKGPVVDEESEFAQVRARFLDLPEARPLHEARKALAAAQGGMPELPAFELPPEAADRKPSSPPGGEFDLSTLLDQLGREPNIPSEKTAELRGKLGEADDKLRAALPNLPPGGTVLDALLDALSPPGAEAPADPQTAMTLAAEKRHDALSEAAATLDAQEAKVVEALAQSRRMAPVATQPRRKLLRSVARRLGDLILAEARAGRPLRGCDMAGADLRGADLRGLDLEGALMERADLGGARLNGARLVDAALTEAVLDGADVGDVDLSGANLAKCRARGTDFSRAILSKSLLMEADLDGAVFDGARLTEVQVLKGHAVRARFAGAVLDGCIFIQCELDETIWDSATLTRVQILDLSLRESSWRWADLTRCALIKIVAPAADFAEARISHCGFLGEADLGGASFAGAVGGNAGFGQANLTGADFSNARFDGSGFDRAVLAGASFRLASLKGSLFGGAGLAGADLVGANLFKAQLRRADLGGALLVGANLYAATLNDADLTGADLTGANLAKTLLEVDTNVG